MTSYPDSLERFFDRHGYLDIEQQPKSIRLSCKRKVVVLFLDVCRFCQPALQLASFGRFIMRRPGLCVERESMVCGHSCFQGIRTACRFRPRRGIRSPEKLVKPSRTSTAAGCGLHACSRTDRAPPANSLYVPQMNEFVSHRCQNSR
jgi:hypothetical protein